MYLQQINTYPIKSTHPISLVSSYLFDTGVAYDRHWMVVDANGAMLTSRTNPKLLHIKTRIENRVLVVEMPHMMFQLPLKSTPGAQQMVQHWGEDLLRAWPQTAQFDAALSDYLGVACRLVYSASLKSVGEEESASFADSEPLLITTTASLDELNSRLPEPMTMQRFRSNLVISNHIADVEDDWKRIRIGACELELVYPCERCVLTTIDPETLAQHPKAEPLRTLADYRRLDKGGVGFGMNARVIKGGVIAVHDTVEVLA